MPRIRPYLQLVRLPNLFTAAADPLAGWLVASGTLAEPARWLPLVAASVSIYAAGIVLNDVFDLPVDRVERPGRPLPSGQVSPRLAGGFGATCLVLGPILAALSGSATSAVVAGLLALCVLAYDAGLKRTPIGPFAMGSCRGLSLLLGLSQAPDFVGPTAWVAAGSMALFVAGVTWISRSEVGEKLTREMILGVALQALAIAGLLVASAGLARLVNGSTRLPGYGLVALGMVAMTVGRADARALRRPDPPTVQRAVKTGVLSLVWLDVALVASAWGPVEALAVAALWAPAFLLARWLYAT